MFDNICRYLAEHFSTDIAAWLLEEPIALTRLSPSELALQPIRADALILRRRSERLPTSPATPCLPVPPSPPHGAR